MKKKKKKSKSILPTKKTKVKDRIQDYTFLIHGEPKIGKTTLCSEFGDVLFLNCDPPQRALSIYSIQINSFTKLEKAIRELKEDCSIYSMVVLDGVDIAYRLCFKRVCKERNVNHPNDVKDWGATWTAIKERFADVVTGLMNLPIATWFICHSTWKEVETQSGDTFEKLCPFLTSQAEEAILGNVDLIGAYTYYKKRRVLIIDGNETVAAGHRIKDKFLTIGGSRVKDFYTGDSSPEAKAKIEEAFNCELESSTVVVRKKKTKKVKKVKQ